MPAGAQVWDEAGNITLDTNTLTVRDAGIYAADNITSTGNITVPVTIPAEAILVVKNNGSGLNVPPLPDVQLDLVNNRIVINNSGGSFNLGVRLVMLQ